MKKITALILILFLAACGDVYTLHEDFNADLEQVLNKLDAAYEENRRLTDDEKNLVNKFTGKYEIGQFITDDEAYEMNDSEKAITDNIKTMELFTEHEESLASEENLYETLRNEIDEYIENGEVPERLVGKYPTYEIYTGVHPEVKEDAQKIIDSFDNIVNGDTSDVTTLELGVLSDFIIKYKESEFEVDDKLYLMNDSGYEILFVVEKLKEDINSGALLNETVDRFNEVKEMINY